jgi:hypothetical protein
MREANLPAPDPEALNSLGIRPTMSLDGLGRL